MDDKQKLADEIRQLEQKQWDAIQKDEKLKDKLAAASKLYELGLSEECKAVQSYMDLLACGCIELDDADRQSIMEIIADELNHIRKLQTIIKKYQTIKPANK